MTRSALAGIGARRRGYRVTGVQQSARGVSLPAPVEGWDAVTPLAAMPETRAVKLDNFFPQPGYIEIRKGHKRHNLVGAGLVESLMPYHGLTTASDRLFAACSTTISNVTVFTSASASATASISLSSLSNARWQHVNFPTSGGQYLWICNGADAPRMYDGSNWATASVTGITATDVINVAVFKNRLWLTRKDKLSPAYLATDSIAGAATVFDLVGLFSKGGYLQAIGSWSLDSGSGPDDYIAFVTSNGEVAVYTGTDPAANFVLKGVYQMGSPLGRRCLTKVGADLAVISQDGVLPLSRALVTDRAAAISISLTAKIQPVMNQSARDYGAHFGWQLIGYPRGTRAILNVPVTEGVLQDQYVMNTVTGAWCRFKRENANVWAVFQDKLYYGGNTGLVCEADCQGYDDDGSIIFDIETAPTYCETRGRLKNFTMCRALLTTDGQVRPGLGINVDFSTQSEVGLTSFETSSAALWDVADWDGGTWPETVRIVTDWISVSGNGYAVGMRTYAEVSPGDDVDPSQSLTLAVNGYDLLMVDGAFL